MDNEDKFDDQEGVDGDDLGLLDADAPDAEPEAEAAPESLESLRAMNEGLAGDVATLVARKETAAVLKEMPAFDNYPLARRKKELAEAVCEILSEFDLELGTGDVIFREVPPRLDGDFSVDVPKLKQKREGEGKGESIQRFRTEVLPKLMAELADKVSFPITLDQKGIFLNVTFDRTALVNDILGQVDEMGEAYGDSDVNVGEKIVVDFSSPNTAKTMHIGHLRSTLIGQVVINLLKSTGAVTYGVNHLGDWGTQFGQLVTAYRLWGEELAKEINFEEEPVKFLATLYARIKQAIEKEKESDSSELADVSRQNFSDLEAGDPELLGLWKKFRDLSLIEFQQIYDRLGIEFDMVLGESYFEGRMDEPVEECIEQGFAAYDEKGALVLDLDDVGLKTCLLKTTDGRSVYLTRDVAAIRQRRQDFNATKILYVIGSEQELHLNQIFETATRLGDIEGGECEHIPFGLITQDGEKIASRKGAGGLDELLDQMAGSARESLTSDWKKNVITAEEADEIAEQVGRSALFYANLAQGLIHNIEFKPEKMLDLNSQSGPYIQYTYVRVLSLLGALGDTEATPLSNEIVASLPPDAHKIVDMVARFPETVAEATNRRAPHILAVYLYELSSVFNSLYTGGKTGDGRMKDLDPEKKAAYARVLSSVELILKKGLGLLNINVLEKM